MVQEGCTLDSKYIFNSGRAYPMKNVFLFLLITLAGCRFGGVSAVSPEEIPELENRLAEDPNNGQLLLRYAAALFSADRCDTASVVARLGAVSSPGDAVAPMVIGQCLERDADFGPAINEYQSFLANYPDAKGAQAVRGRLQIARRMEANEFARQALANEAALSGGTPDPDVIAVLPLVVTSSDSSLQPLGRGLAQMLISDLGLIERFRMVERTRLNALIQEMRLGQTEQVQSQTAARVGRLIRAGRMVQGTANLPPEETVRLVASVVRSSGEILGPETIEGEFSDLLDLEKRLVIGISSRLGYPLSEAEIAALLENGTQNLTAFLAYSRGLEAEDRGDYRGAAMYFSQAVQADPGFEQAQAEYEVAVVADVVEDASPGEVTTVVNTDAASPVQGPPPTESAMNSNIGDVAGQQGEQSTQSGHGSESGGESGESGNTGTGTSTANPNGTNTSKNTSSTVTGTIRIVFRLP